MGDYWDYLVGRVRHYLTGEDPVTPRDHYDYVTDTHPTKGQYDKQQLIGIVFPGYAEYMRAKSQDEYNDKVREMYGIDFDDITYPWLSNVLSNGAMTSVASGAWEYSRNLWKLYK